MAHRTTIVLIACQNFKFAGIFKREGTIAEKNFICTTRKKINKIKVRYVEPFRNLVSELLRAKDLSSSDALLEIKAYFKSISEVRILKDRKIYLELISPLNTIMKPQEFWAWKVSDSSQKMIK